MSNFIDPVKFARSYLMDAGSSGIANLKDAPDDRLWYSPQDSSVPGEPPSLETFDRDVRKMMAESADTKQVEQYCGLSLLVASVSALNAAGAATGGPILVAMAGNVGKELIPPETMKKMGEEGLNYLKIKYGTNSNPALNERMKKVCGKLLEASNLDDSSYAVHVLESPESNAHSIPGHIFATRGLMEKFENDDRLAFVLGHEIAHGENMDSLEDQGENALENLTVSKTMRKWKLPVTGTDKKVYDLRKQIKQIFYKDTIGLERENELAADRRGIEIMFRAGYNPQEAIFALNDLYEGHEYVSADSGFGGHPSRGERVREAVKFIEQLKERN